MFGLSLASLNLPIVPRLLSNHLFFLELELADGSLDLFLTFSLLIDFFLVVNLPGLLHVLLLRTDSLHSCRLLILNLL